MLTALLWTAGDSDVFFQHLDRKSTVRGKNCQANGQARKDSQVRDAREDMERNIRGGEESCQSTPSGRREFVKNRSQLNEFSVMTKSN